MQLSKRVTSTNDVSLEKLSEAVRIAIGYRTIANFAGTIKMVDTTLLTDIIYKRIREYPPREVLRKIASASEGRITYKYLYDICGYSELDEEEDRSWAKWTPSRGEIYCADFGTNLDSEQNSVRPCVIVSNDIGNKMGDILVVIPITTKRKFTPRIHVHIGKEYGLKEDSYALTEQIRCISKRRLFYNGEPWRISILDEEKMNEIKNALEIELGFEEVMFDEDKAFKMIEHINTLTKYVKDKKSFDLQELLEEKYTQLVNYCAKYKRDIDAIWDTYENNIKVKYAV